LRPAIFIAITDSLALRHALAIRGEIGNKQYDELDMVIQCAGGDIHAAYLIIEFFRSHTKKLNACVPFLALSAATLLCIGADMIYLDELAQLGPLDTQIEERGKGGRIDFVSALNPFKAMEQVQNFSLETMDLFMKMIIQKSGLEIDECFKHATEFVKATTGPLIAQLNPEKIGAYSRALQIGVEYGKRVLHRFLNWDEKKCEEVINRLVYGYPSHDYTLDYRELQEVGFPVKLFSDEEKESVQKLFALFLKEKQIIKLVNYEKKDKTNSKDSKKGASNESNSTLGKTKKKISQKK
jgi:hypothetical protein